MPSDRSRTDRGLNDPNKQSAPSRSEGLPGYGQPPEGVRNPSLGGPNGRPEDLEDVSQDGGGQKTNVGEPYKGDETVSGTERELQRDTKKKDE